MVKGHNTELFYLSYLPCPYIVTIANPVYLDRSSSYLTVDIKGGSNLRSTSMKVSVLDFNHKSNVKTTYCITTLQSANIFKVQSCKLKKH